MRRRTDSAHTGGKVVLLVIVVGIFAGRVFGRFVFRE